MKRFATRAFLAAFLLLGCTAAALHAAQEGITPEERWKNMTPEQQEILRSRYRVFKELSGEQQIV